MKIIKHPPGFEIRDYTYRCHWCDYNIQPDEEMEDYGLYKFHVGHAKLYCDAGEKTQYDAGKEEVTI